MEVLPVNDPFRARSSLETEAGPVVYYGLAALEEAGLVELARLPYSMRILLESLLRNLDGFVVTEQHLRSLAAWAPGARAETEIPFLPGRVLLQDFTGVPAIVDLAAMRSAMVRLGGDPERINPVVPVDLVIDHSVQVDAYGSRDALERNIAIEFERNRERYEFLRWGQMAFQQFRVVPPASGIVHQVNLEHLATVVQTRSHNGETVAFPDTLVGTDSHTTMVNGLGVLGWGVGGIEAEAVMLNQPIAMLIPEVVGVRLTGQLAEGVTATDLVLVVTELLRRHGVVGKFVEFFGPGLDQLTLPDRATVANMAPEYGATIGFFPVDAETIRYLRVTGRDAGLVERYCRAQGLFRAPEAPEPTFSETLVLDMATVEPSIAGPRRPHDRVPLRQAKAAFRQALRETYGVSAADEELDAGAGSVGARLDGLQAAIRHGSVVIAAISSCTNTSSPTGMLMAGLLASKAVARGLNVPPWVKTSLAPGSRVVTRYLERAGLLPYLEALRFHVVGYGCTTCIGNSGPIAESISQAVQEGKLVVAAVLSGNRNFEGRVSPLTRANYLASPALVVAYALAGTVDIDLANEPLAHDPNGTPVYLRDLWPTREEVARAAADAVAPELFGQEYGRVFEGSEAWLNIPVAEGTLYRWDEASTYIKEPPFFTALTAEPQPVAPILGARVLALLGDSVTTDHISPAGSIPVSSPAGQYLLGLGISKADFNSYGARRGNHEVMMRGTFANIRLRNLLAPGTEGGVTIHIPSGEQTTIFEAAMRYRQEGTPVIVIAGREYGSGSSRDWAAKGPYLLGVRAVIAQSFERIHRANLVGMGILPLEFAAGQSWQTLGLTGHEQYDIDLPARLEPRQPIQVTATDGAGKVIAFTTTSRIDAPVEVQYVEHGGILHFVLRQMLAG